MVTNLAEGQMLRVGLVKSTCWVGIMAFKQLPFWLGNWSIPLFGGDNFF